MVLGDNNAAWLPLIHLANYSIDVDDDDDDDDDDDENNNAWINEN